MTLEAGNSPERVSGIRLSLPRAHRLKRRRLIRPLFDRDRADVRYLPSGCVRGIYRFVADPELDPQPPIQVGFFVGRRAGSAVHRNRIRRRMREAYRHRHPELSGVLAGRQDFMTLALVFRGDPQGAWPALRRDVNLLVDRLIEDLA